MIEMLKLIDSKKELGLKNACYKCLVYKRNNMTKREMHPPLSRVRKRIHFKF
jgi:hypothetical protein